MTDDHEDHVRKHAREDARGLRERCRKGCGRHGRGSACLHGEGLGAGRARLAHGRRQASGVRPALSAAARRLARLRLTRAFWRSRSNGSVLVNANELAPRGRRGRLHKRLSSLPESVQTHRAASLHHIARRSEPSVSAAKRALGVARSVAAAILRHVRFHPSVSAVRRAEDLRRVAAAAPHIARLGGSAPTIDVRDTAYSGGGTRVCHDCA
jgi:hypothetical protein